MNYLLVYLLKESDLQAGRAPDLYTRETRHLGVNSSPKGRDL